MNSAVLPLFGFSVTAILLLMNRSLFLTVSLCLALSVPLEAKDKAPVQTKVTKKPAARTWEHLIEHVMKNGADRPLKGALAKNLGYTAEENPAKAMRIKEAASPDKYEHAIFITQKTDKDERLVPDSVVMVKNKTTKVDNNRYVEGVFVRFDLKGKILTAVRSKGMAKDVELNTAAPTEPDVQAAGDYERNYFLKNMPALSSK